MIPIACRASATARCWASVLPAFRCSEVCALEVSDLTPTKDGLRIRIRRSKTDCQGLDQQVAVIRGERIQPDMLRVYSRRVDLFRMVGSGRKETLCFGNQHAEVPFAARQRCWIA
jgi:hypothetical protein